MPGDTLGVLLVNTGTPAAPRPRETRAYLRQFLSDPRILDMPALLRALLLYGVILPFRPKKSAAAYAQIWGEDGSPLLAISRRLQHELQTRLSGAVVELGMRYGAPSIADALERLRQCKVARIVVVPVFPQYAAATTGSILAEVYRLAARPWNVTPITVLPPFFDDEGFLSAWEAVARPALEEFKPDHTLLSYHGLPERHIHKSDPTGAHCLATEDCCTRVGADVLPYCYRAQCHATTETFAARLNLAPETVTMSFQSRLGRAAWIRPATDATVRALAHRGVKRLLVVCPAFTADCLETLEEIGIRAKGDFLKAGGQAFRLVPCLNDHPAWVEALARLIERHAVG